MLADTLINRFGEKRAPFALGVAALFFGFPIFFDAGLVVFLPIILTVARRFGGSLLYYALPAAGAFAAMHALVPPHPGPVAAAGLLDAPVGLTLIVGVPIAVVAWYLGAYLVSRVLAARIDVPMPDLLFGEMNGGRDSDGGGSAGAGGPAGDGTTMTRTAPRFGVVLSLLLLPLVLISCNTVVDTLGSAGVIGGTRPGRKPCSCSATRRWRC